MPDPTTLILYRIYNWDLYFETHDTRKLKALKWIPLPNKQDGDGYTELMDHPNGAAHFGVWTALLQLASKCSDRGLLMRSTGAPHDPESIARITRIPKAMIEEAIGRFLQIKWLEDLRESPGRTGESPGTPGNAPANLPLQGREGKGREGKGTAGEGSPAQASPPADLDGIADPKPVTAAPKPRLGVMELNTIPGIRVTAKDRDKLVAVLNEVGIKILTAAVRECIDGGSEPWENNITPIAYRLAKAAVPRPKSEAERMVAKHGWQACVKACGVPPQTIKGQHDAIACLTENKSLLEAARALLGAA